MLDILSHQYLKNFLRDQNINWEHIYSFGRIISKCIENDSTYLINSEIFLIHDWLPPILISLSLKQEDSTFILSEEKIPHNLLNAKPENVEREAEIVAQAGRAGAVTIATNMAGRGTDIILGGNSDYMARLKLKEILIPLLVKPDNEHKPPIPKQRNSKSKGGFSTKAGSNLKKNISNSSTSLFPCKLDEAIEKKLSLLSNELVQNWGDRQLSVLELDDKIATASEKAPTEDKLIKLLRESLSDVKNEYDKVLLHEEEKVREAGGLHVIGTERHESRRVYNQL